MSEEELRLFGQHEYAFVGGILYDPALSDHHGAIEFETPGDLDKFLEWLHKETVIFDYCFYEIWTHYHPRRN